MYSFAYREGELAQRETIFYLTMLKKLCALILKLLGWKQEGEIPESRKFIVIVAPHTSNWDYVIGQLFYFSKGIRAKTMIKKELFFFPLNILLKIIGGIPVERSKKTNIVDQMVKEFEKNEEFILTITPEGTRKRVTNWKRGFYRIAIKANVPVLLGYFDYKRKVVGIGGFFEITGDENEDMKKIKKFYSNVTAKYPDKFSTGEE